MHGDELEPGLGELGLGKVGDFVVTGGQHVALPVAGHGALADAETELGADELHDLRIGAVFIV